MTDRTDYDILQGILYLCFGLLMLWVVWLTITDRHGPDKDGL